MNPSVSVNEFNRSRFRQVKKIQLKDNEKKGWWKSVRPDYWTYRAKAKAQVNDQGAEVLFDTGAEVSLIDSNFVRKWGLDIDSTKAQRCAGVGGAPYETEGVCTVKITLANELAYEVPLLVGPMEGQDVILGMDFMAPAGVRLDAADGSVCLPDEVYVRFEGRRQLFSAHARPIYMDTVRKLDPGAYVDVRVGRTNDQVLWLKRGKTWVTTAVRVGRIPRWIRVINVSAGPISLNTLDQLGVWMSEGHVPRKPGYVSDGSKRSIEWYNLGLQATVEDQEVEGDPEEEGPCVERVTYVTPTAILRRDSDARESQEFSSTIGSPDSTAVATVASICAVPEADQAALDSKQLGSTSTEDGDSNGPAPAEVGSTASGVMATGGNEYPGRPRILTAVTVSEMVLNQDGAADEVVVHESEDPTVEDLEAGMALIPDLEAESTAAVTMEDLKVGDLAKNTPAEIWKLRNTIWKRSVILIGKGNAMPPAAKGVICDIDVGDAKPVAQGVRKVRLAYLDPLFKLIKGLLENKLIQPSKSEWASPIVIVLKKNGDIRLCIDYRMVNALTKLMVYPMPLVSDLLENLDKMLWYCSLDMASGFWVVQMTKRARLISAFITPFGLFEWLRMPFGLKNAPQIYQRIVDNVVYNTFRISNDGDSVEYDVFTSGLSADPDAESLLKRRSYIDDFLIPSKSWDELCEIVGKFLDACVYWNLSISVDKSVWGHSVVEYLGHKVSRRGIQANPKDPQALLDLPFPTTLKAMQSFLGSLNYYSRFIDDYATIAAVLYEWKPQTSRVVQGSEPWSAESEVKARRAFEMLKGRFEKVPELRHFDPDLPAIVAVYATDWSISGALLQQYGDMYEPIRFTSRVLKKHERNYSDGEREILALLRVLDVCHNQLAGRTIRVITSHTTMAWIWKSKGLQGRLSVWAALLSGWSLEIQRGTGGVLDFLGVVAASAAPMDQANEILEAIAPLSTKKTRSQIPVPIPTLREDTSIIVASFDGSAKPKRAGGSCSAVLWKFPEWTVIRAASRYFDDITVNEAEYRGIQLVLELVQDLQIPEVVICGDSKLVIQQLRGDMECRATGLQLLRETASRDLKSLKWQSLVHVKREWNAAADLLATRALQAQCGVQSVDPALAKDLEALNRLHEVILVEDPSRESTQAVVAAVQTRRQRAQPRRIQDPEAVIGLRVERLRHAQEEELWVKDLKAFLAAEVDNMDQRTIQRCAKVADDFEVDDDGILCYVSRGRRNEDGSNDVNVRIVIPSTLIDDVLHHYHTSMEGGHQGVGRTYTKAKKSCYWRSMFRDIQRYVSSCVDCQTGKGRPWIRGPSPGNIQATYPFQVIAMDHIPSMPVSHRGNTELLLWVDLFTGYVIAKANSSRTAVTVAESYEESVFRRFGASECIRHDREPGFMAEFFEAFNKLMGQRQRATMSYRPQANGSAERMVQTLSRAVRMYVEDEGQRDWDEYAERLVFALNTSHDRVRDETPFYLVHGWDPKTTLESTMMSGCERAQDRDPRRWRYHIQRQYLYARHQVAQFLRDAQAERAAAANERVNDHPVVEGSKVWLYIERVREGLARKLAHKWHGPFRVAEVRDGFMCKLEVAGSGYRVSPWVHLSRLKVFKDSPVRPIVPAVVDPTERLDFDEGLLPEDSFEPDPEDGVFEVEELLDRRVVRNRTRQGRQHVEYLVKWKGYEEPTWIQERDLNCGGLIYDFNQRQKARNRFQAMQAAAEPSPP